MGSNRPGTRHSDTSCRGVEPASRARMICAQSRLAAAPANSAPAAGATLDPAAGELCRIQEPRQLLARQIGQLSCDLTDRPSFRVRLLGNGCALFVADHGIQRGYQNGIALERLGEPRLVHPETRD